MFSHLPAPPVCSAGTPSLPRHPIPNHHNSGRTPMRSLLRLRNEEHSRLQEMRSQHAGDVASASRRRVAALASLARQVELDREEWGRRAKEESSAGDEVGYPCTSALGILCSYVTLSPHTRSKSVNETLASTSFLSNGSKKETNFIFLEGSPIVHCLQNMHHLCSDNQDETVSQILSSTQIRNVQQLVTQRYAEAE